MVKTAYSRWKTKLSSKQREKEFFADFIRGMASRIVEAIASGERMARYLAAVGMPLPERLSPDGIDSAAAREMMAALDGAKLLPEPNTVDKDEIGANTIADVFPHVKAALSAKLQMWTTPAAPTPPSSTDTGTPGGTTSAARPLRSFTSFLSKLPDETSSAQMQGLLDAFGIDVDPEDMEAEGDAEIAAEMAKEAAQAVKDRLASMDDTTTWAAPTDMDKALEMARVAKRAFKAASETSPKAAKKAKVTARPKGELWTVLQTKVAVHAQESVLIALATGIMRGKEAEAYAAGFPELALFTDDQDCACSMTKQAFERLKVRAPKAWAEIDSDAITSVSEFRTQLQYAAQAAVWKSIAPHGEDTRGASSPKRRAAASESTSDDDVDDSESSDMSDTETKGSKGKQKFGFKTHQLETLIELPIFKKLAACVMSETTTDEEKRIECKAIFLDQAPGVTSHAQWSMRKLYMSGLSKGSKKEHARRKICKAFKIVRRVTGTHFRQACNSDEADAYEVVNGRNATLDTMWLWNRQLDPLLVEAVPLFARRKGPREQAAEAMETRKYEAALLRMVPTIMSVHEGLFPATTLNTIKEALEDYDEPTSTAFHVNWWRPFMNDLFERYRGRVNAAMTTAPVATRAGAPSGSAEARQNSWANKHAPCTFD